MGSSTGNMLVDNHMVLNRIFGESELLDSYTLRRRTDHRGQQTKIQRCGQRPLITRLTTRCGGLLQQLADGGATGQ